MEHMIYTRDRHPDTHIRTHTEETTQCRYTHTHNPKATVHKGKRGNGLANRRNTEKTQRPAF